MSKNTFQGKLLVSDMDGTLLNNKHELSTENARAIEYFIENGGIFTVATGRNEFLVEKFMPQLPINAPAIVYNGAAIYDFSKKELLWESYLDDTVTDFLNNIIVSMPSLGVKIFHDGEIYLVQSNNIMNDIIIRENFKPKEAAIADVPKPWFKVMFSAEPEELKEVEAVLKQNPTTFRYVYSEPTMLELLNKEASKGSALKELMSILGIDKSNVIAIGDNLNDIELLEMAGIGIAVSNAHEDLKPYAAHCCCHHDENAVSQVIKWLENGII